MKVNREQLLQDLKTAAVGLTNRELLEQSNAFVFTKSEVITFNGEILTRTGTPCPWIRGAVVADDLTKLLSKFPDEEVDLKVEEGELLLKGTRKNAGLTMQAEVLLPYKEVPRPRIWKRVPSSLSVALLQAARVCGRDETQPRTTEVHVTPYLVEASDNFRLFRQEFDTGIKNEVLIPASTVEAIGGIPFVKVSEGEGWIHFKTKTGNIVSARTNQGDYPDLEPHLELEGPRKITLPSNLAEILGRAEVMHETALDASVSISIFKDKLVLKASKNSGWYKESKKIKYSGRALQFQVHPKFLQDILTKTRNVRIGGNRMKFKTGSAVFIVCLEVVE